MFIQAGFAVDPPTACHLVWGARYMKADLTHQFVWWCVHKLVVISAIIGSIGSHLLQRLQYETATTFLYAMMASCLVVNLLVRCHSVDNKHTQKMTHY